MCADCAGTAGSTYVREHIKNAQSIGVIIGTSVSAAMLMLIGAINLYVAAKLLKRWRVLRKERKAEQALIESGGMFKQARP